MVVKYFILIFGLSCAIFLTTPWKISKPDNKVGSIFFFLVLVLVKELNQKWKMGKGWKFIAYQNKKYCSTTKILTLRSISKQNLQIPGVVRRLILKVNVENNQRRQLAWDSDLHMREYTFTHTHMNTHI